MDAAAWHLSSTKNQPAQGRVPCIVNLYLPGTCEPQNPEQMLSMLKLQQKSSCSDVSSRPATGTSSLTSICGGCSFHDIRQVRATFAHFLMCICLLISSQMTSDNPESVARGCTDPRWVTGSCWPTGHELAASCMSQADNATPGVRLWIWSTFAMHAPKMCARPETPTRGVAGSCHGWTGSFLHHLQSFSLGN